jgi:WD40 repeat protein
MLASGDLSRKGVDQRRPVFWRLYRAMTIMAVLAGAAALGLMSRPAVGSSTAMPAQSTPVDGQATGPAPDYTLAMGDVVVGVAWHPTDPVLAAWDYDRRVSVWEPGDEATLLQEELGHITSAAWSPDGGSLAVSSTDGVSGWSYPALAAVAQVAFDHPVSDVEWLADNQTVLIRFRRVEQEGPGFTLYENDYRLWAFGDDSSRPPTPEFDWNPGEVRPGPGGQLLAWWDRQWVFVYDAQMGETVASFGLEGDVMNLYWHPTDDRLMVLWFGASSADSGPFVAPASIAYGLWEPGSESGLTRTFEHHELRADGIWLDDTRFVVQSTNGQILILDSATGQVTTLYSDDILAPYGIGQELGRSPQSSPDGQQLVLFGDGEMFVARLDGSGIVRLKNPYERRADPVQWAWHPASRFLAVAFNTGAVIVWDVESGEVVQVLEPVYQTRQPNRPLLPDVAWSPGGRYLVSWGVDNLVRVWESAALLPAE